MGSKVRIKRSKKRSLWPNRVEIAGLAGAGVLAALLAVPMFLPEAIWHLDESPSVGGDSRRGAYIADAAGCATCHTLPGKVPYSGGYAIRTPFGSVVASNITPDPIAGIGRWRFDDFRRAMLLGLSPEGRHYYPAFPYLNYKDMQEGDLADLFAYLQSLPPSGQEVVENQLVAPFSFRPAMAVWKLLYLEPPGSVSERGAYLTEVLGHCDVCHTIRNFLGAPVDGQHLSGVGEEASINAGTPNVTPHEEGLLRWSEAALTRYLVSAVRPDGQVSGGQMAEVIKGVTSRLTTEDRAAMVAYLRNLPAQPTP